MRMGGIVLVIYLVIGVIVAATQGYFGGFGSLSGILEALLAIVAWPLILLGVDFNIGGVGADGGGGGNGGGGNGGGNGG